jgi:polyisoprenoid-binding protein YceI
MERTKWAFDPTHSELSFKIKHLMIANVSGSFTGFDVEMESDGEDLASASIRARVQMNSINTKNLQRDEHLRQSDFFEVEKYPEMEFRSTSIEKLDSSNYLLHGNLKLKGITHPVVLNVEYGGLTKDPWGGERAGFAVTGKINRSQWGISFNSILETGGLALGEEVKINSEIQLVKQAVEVAV